jgi:hypothetical protein
MKPIYVQARKELPSGIFHIWHKLVANQPSKAPLTALTACGDRFEPEGFLYGHRTLIDWGEDDDLCECAAEVPSEGQCKDQLSVLKLGTPEQLACYVQRPDEDVPQVLP